VLLSLEHGAQHQRGRNASFAQMGPGCGSILGTAAVAALTLSMSPAVFESWGWRIAFWSSAVLVAFGLWLRSGVTETPAFIALASRRATAKTPIKDVFRHHLRPLLTAIGARAGHDVAYALLTVFSLTYVTTVLHLSRPLALIAAMTGASCHALAIPLFGALSDRIGRRPVYAAGTILTAFWVFAFFRLMDSRQPCLIVVAVVGGLLIHAMMYGPQAAFITEQFPSRVRYAGSSLGYTLAGVVAGGFAPLIFAALYRAYGTTIPLSLYVTVALAVTLFTLAVSRETAKAPLAD
jgi:MFS family permease